MLAKIQLSTLWLEPEIAKRFFMRSQAYSEFEKLCRLVGAEKDAYALDDLEERVSAVYETLDDFEEDLYNLSTEEICEILGIY